MRWLWLLLGLAACQPVAKRCEALCVRFVDECAFPAWPSVESCRAGCVDELYRRDDVDEVLACYHAAIEPLDEATADAKVQQGVEAGLWAAEIAGGTFDRPATVAETAAAGRCDPFAVLQCRVEAATAPAPAPLVRGYR